MKTMKFGRTALQVPVIGLGCMRITGLNSVREVRTLVDTAMEQGVNFFDHADIYGKGESERIFGEATDPAMREKMIIQTKCGICPGISYDFSKEHILKSVDESLKRLNTEYLDILLLHRPDTLMEPEEVAEAFDKLEASGKVRYFGVSNQNSMQMELLNKYCGNKIMADQLQFSIAHCDIIDSGIMEELGSENLGKGRIYGCKKEKKRKLFLETVILVGVRRILFFRLPAFYYL